MIDILNNIVKNKRPVFFISPHFDDAALSAGSLLSYLSKKTSVTVINVFTKCGPINTLSARAYLRQLKCHSAEELYLQRAKEDKNFFSSIGAKSVNLNYVEALWRQFEKKPGKTLAELDHIYPTYRFHIISGKI